MTYVKAWIGKTNPHSNQKNPIHRLTLDIANESMQHVLDAWGQQYYSDRCRADLILAQGGVILKHSLEGKRRVSQSKVTGRYQISFDAGCCPALADIDPPFGRAQVRATIDTSNGELYIPFPAHRVPPRQKKSRKARPERVMEQGTVPMVEALLQIGEDSHLLLVPAQDAINFVLKHKKVE